MWGLLIRWLHNITLISLHVFLPHTKVLRNICINLLNLLLHLDALAFLLRLKQGRTPMALKTWMTTFQIQVKVVVCSPFLFMWIGLSYHNLLFYSIQLYGKIINEQCHRLVRLTYDFTVLNLGPIHFCWLMRAGQRWL